MSFLYIGLHTTWSIIKINLLGVFINTSWQKTLWEMNLVGSGLQEHNLLGPETGGKNLETRFVLVIKWISVRMALVGH